MKNRLCDGEIRGLIKNGARRLRAVGKPGETNGSESMNGYARQTSSLAIISMVCGILSYFLGLLLTIVSLCFGLPVGGMLALAAVVLI